MILHFNIPAYHYNLHHNQITNVLIYIERWTADVVQIDWSLRENSTIRPKLHNRERLLSPLIENDIIGL
jgi:hypothetical protein